MKPSPKNLRSFIVTGTVLFIASFLVAPAATAAPLNLWLMDFPDVFSSAITTSYDHVTHEFVSSGYATTLTMDGETQQFITNEYGSGLVADSFHIEAIINNSGVAASGSLQISGYYIEDGINSNDNHTIDTEFTSGTLLTGNLTDFGWLEKDGTYALFEFLFEVTSGDLMPYFSGSPAGVILGLGDYGYYETNPLFESSFSMDTMVSDTAPVPAPAALLLLGSGLIGLIRVRRKR